MLIMFFDVFDICFGDFFDEVYHIRHTLLQAHIFVVEEADLVYAHEFGCWIKVIICFFEAVVIIQYALQ